MAGGTYYAIEISRIPVGIAAKDGEVWDGVFPVRETPCPKERGEDLRPYICVNDNGDMGDGVILTVERDDEAGNVCSCAIPLKSIELIIEALTTVKRLRLAQKNSESIREDE